MRHGGRDLFHLGVGERPAVEEEPAVADDPDDRRRAAAQQARERLLHGACEARQLGERERNEEQWRDLFEGTGWQPVRIEDGLIEPVCR